jgi:hypothetical protein
MNSKLKFALAAGALAFSAQAAADITFYEHESFRGRSFTSEQSINNMQRAGFNDRASSVVVTGQRGDRWEVCSDRRFGGQCRVLRPGRYPSLASLGLNDRVSSAREIDRNSRVDNRRYPPQRSNMQVTFYEHEGYQGRSFTANRQVDNFQQAGFNDLASAVDVAGRSVEVCSDAGFQGRCVVLNPGRYPSVMAMGLNDRISSVRVVDTNQDRRDYSRDNNRDYSRRN